jgi:hypothetical protein
MIDLYLGLAQLVGQPIQTLVETVTLDRTGGLDVPLKQRKRVLGLNSTVPDLFCHNIFLIVRYRTISNLLPLTFIV